jgi:hypothetical protein
MIRGVSWNCERDGCFNRKKRPKFGAFASCFPRPNLSFTDVDAVIERRGFFLFLEFKGEDVDVPTAQRILLEQLTRLSDNVIAMVVSCDCETMTVTHVQPFDGGAMGQRKACTLRQLQGFVRRWYEDADKGKRPTVGKQET